MVCHQGRQSTPSVDKKPGQLADDTVNPSLGFINIHYRAAAATMCDSEAKGSYSAPVQQSGTLTMSATKVNWLDSRARSELFSHYCVVAERGALGF